MRFQDKEEVNRIEMEGILELLENIGGSKQLSRN
jgi:hypothetical protein